MTTPAYSIIFSAKVNGASGSVAVGNVVIPSASAPTYYVVATAAARGTRRSEGIALTAYGGSAVGSIEIQQCGTISATLSGLSAGVASWVRCSATGTIERCTPAPGDDIIGYAEADGRVHLCFGFLTSSITSGGGGGSTPTGTGLRKVVAGVENAAASLLVNADVDAAAAIAGTKVSPDFGSQNVTTTGSIATTGSYIAAGSATIPSTGTIRIPNTHWITSRDAGSNDLNMMRVSAAANLEVWGTGAAFGDNIQNAPSGQRHVFQDQLVYRLVLKNTGVHCSLPIAGDGVLAGVPYRKKVATWTQSSTADKTLSTTEYECPDLNPTGTAGGSFNIIAPTSSGAEYKVVNDNASQCIIKTAAGAGVTVAAARTAIVRCDGTNYKRVTADVAH